MSRQLNKTGGYRSVDWSDPQPSDTEALGKVAFIGAKLLRPPIYISLKDWADSNRILAPGAARPGRWQTDWAPCAPEVYEMFSDRNTKEIIVVCSTQLMKSELIINGILYLVEVHPAPIMLLQPDVDLANKFSTERIGGSAALMKYHQPYLSPGSGPGKKTNGTKKRRPFPGGTLIIRSAAETSALISDSIKFIFCDEVNKFPRDIRGDLKSRQTMFPDSKTVMVSSAGPYGLCRITSEFERGDQREWHIVCPDCGVAQIPDFEQLKWPDKKPEFAVYICSDCDFEITNGKMKEANRNGYWVAKRESNDGIISFRVNSFAHPGLSLADIAREFLDATSNYEQTGIDTRLRVFWTDRMSVNYENATGSINPSKLKKAFAMDYPNARRGIPDEVIYISIAVDVQDDRLEVEAVGWGYQISKDIKGGTVIKPVRYGLEYFKIVGSTADQKTYRVLQAYFDDTVWTRIDGLRMQARGMGLDSGGHMTDAVIEFCKFKGRGERWIRPLKGVGVEGAPIARFSKTPDVLDRYKNFLVLVGTLSAKDIIFETLRKSSTGEHKDSIWFYPSRPDRGYDSQYFNGLTSERAVWVQRKDTIAKRVYRKITERNEPLDLAVYNLALVRMMRVHEMPRRERELKQKVFDANKKRKNGL